METNKRESIRKCVIKLLASVCLIGSPAFAQTVNINPSTEHQTIRGFGGMNAPGWIADLTSAQVDTAFGNGDGQLGLSIMRMRIDPNSNNWGIQVPAAVRAKSHGAILLASPWSPPAHMKTNNNLNNGGKLRPEYYGAYTDHLLSFTNYMAANNASVYALSIQNEPDWHPNYESCDWNATDFVNYLSTQGSRFGSLRVVAPESLNFNPALSDPFLNNANTAQHVDIIGGHLYGRAPRDYPLARSKGKEIWMTEHYTESQNSANAWPLALDVGTELHQSMVANFNAYIWWYIRRSYGLLTEDGAISKRGYLMAQYSKFVRPGYVRIAATEQPLTGVFVTAYKGPNNRIVVIAVNTTTSHRNLNLNVQNTSLGQFAKYTTSGSLNLGFGGRTAVSGTSASVWVDPQSVATFVSEGTGGTSSSSSSSSSSGGAHTIVVRMRGVAGDESVNLQVGGTTLRTWTLGTSMSDYSASTNSTGDIRVAFTNDNGDRDVQVDYISVNGQVRQAEDQNENTGVWGNSACGGTGFSEWLHCNGYIGFGRVTGAASSSAPASASSSSSSVLSSSSSTTSSTSNGGVTSSIVIDNDWGGGYCATLRVTNNTSAPVTWNVSVAVSGTVSSLWNGSWSQSGSTLTVAGVGWNSQLQPGQTESSVGFCVSR